MQTNYYIASNLDLNEPPEHRSLASSRFSLISKTLNRFEQMHFEREHSSCQNFFPV